MLYGHSYCSHDDIIEMLYLWMKAVNEDKSYPADLLACRFGDEGPVSFDDHRGRLLQILNEEGWPVTEKDIVCLEREIEKGLRFLQQSKDLRQAAADVTSNVKSSPRGRKHSPMNDGSQIEEVSLS